MVVKENLLSTIEKQSSRYLWICSGMFVFMREHTYTAIVHQVSCVNDDYPRR